MWLLFVSPLMKKSCQQMIQIPVLYLSPLSAFYYGICASNSLSRPSSSPAAFSSMIPDKHSLEEWMDPQRLFCDRIGSHALVCDDGAMKLFVDEQYWKAIANAINSSLLHKHITPMVVIFLHLSYFHQLVGLYRNVQPAIKKKAFLLEIRNFLPCQSDHRDASICTIAFGN